MGLINSESVQAGRYFMPLLTKNLVPQKQSKSQDNKNKSFKKISAQKEWAIKNLRPVPSNAYDIRRSSSVISSFLIRKNRE